MVREVLSWSDVYRMTGNNYYGNYGCCLTCEKEEKEEGCLCFDCKCRKCIHYNWNSGSCKVAHFFRLEREVEYERSQEYFYFFNYEIKKETEKGFLVKIEEEEAWLPKSQIEFREDCSRGKAIGIPLWLIEKSSFSINMMEIGYNQDEISFTVQSKLKNNKKRKDKKC